MTPARIVLLLALILFPAGAAASAPAPVPPFVELRTDPRFELLAMVQLLAGADRNSSSFFRHDIPYDRDAEKWFRPYERHPVVEKYQELALNGFDNVELYTLAFMLTDPPELLLPLEKVPADIVANAGGARSLKEFQLMLIDFARASRFSEFYEREAKQRAALVALAAEPLRRADLAGDFRRYTGWEPPIRETVIVSPFAEPVLSANVATADPDGVPRLTYVYGPEVIKGKFRFRLETRFAHLMLEAAGPKLKSALLPFAARLEASKGLYAPVGKACGPDWPDCARRHIAFAVGARLLAARSPVDAAEWPVKYARIGMPYLAPLVESLKEYEAHRALYPTLADYLPRLLDAFDRLAVKEEPAPSFLGRFAESWAAEGPAALIVPGGQDDADARAAAEALRARRRPGAAVLTGERALESDLKGKTLVVIGTPENNAWLARRWRELNLPAHLEDGRIRFNPRPGEDDGAVFNGDLGLATTALNPDDARKPVLLYTGVSPEAALAALAFDPGLADYAVIQGTAAVKVGYYEKSRLPWRLK